MLLSATWEPACLNQVPTFAYNIVIDVTDVTACVCSLHAACSGSSKDNLLCTSGAACPNQVKTFRTTVTAFACSLHAACSDSNEDKWFCSAPCCSCATAADQGSGAVIWGCQSLSQSIHQSITQDSPDSTLFRSTGCVAVYALGTTSAAACPVFCKAALTLDSFLPPAPSQ